MRLQIDFETASECDLLAHGVYRYAQHLSTRVLMMGWAFDDEPVEVWTPDQLFPQRVIDHVKAGGKIAAWNAAFERHLWDYALAPDYDLPVPRLDQWQCTAARARAHGLPGSLADSAKALAIPLQKMTEGRRLIQMYCSPGHADVIPADDLELFIEYCKQDVLVERQIGSVLRELTEHEQYEYMLNEIINDRGVPVDVEFAHAALGYAAEVREAVNDKILQVTGGKVPTARAIKQRDNWLREHLSTEQLDVLTEKDKIKFGQNYRDAIRAIDIPEEVRAFVDLVDEAGGATIGKYTAMVNRQVDGRLCGALSFNGAGQTGRFASQGIQLHNLRRDGLENADEIIQLVIDGYEVPDVTTTLARLVRASIYRPEGLRWFDFSAIEGRVAPWLEGTSLGEAKLDLYRQGVDPYVFNAARLYNIPMEAVDKEQRQRGKVMELALGFLGGAGALQSMGRNYGLTFSNEEGVMLRDVWRQANPWAMSAGALMNKAAILAVRAPGQWIPAGRVAYAYDGRDWLWCRLPSGRVLAYFQPRLEMTTTPWGAENLAVTCLHGSLKPKAGQPWPRRAMHAGIWLENCTQGTAADLLREAAIRCDDNYIDVVLHVHDEIVAEGTDVEQLGRVMLQNPDWATGLPLAGEGGTGTRYGK